MCETSLSALQRQHQQGNYNVTLFSIFALEGHVLSEWVHHYIAEGVDHFVLVDNNAPDVQESCVLSTYISAGIVTLIKDATPHAHRLALTFISKAGQNKRIAA